MLKRKIEEELVAWKANPNRKPIVIKGCRQCGKTTPSQHLNITTVGKRIRDASIYTSKKYRSSFYY